MTAYTMFAGELEGRLELSHIAHRAHEVRSSIAKMFVHGERFIPARDTPLGWSLAKEDGWRVVPVIVQDRRAWLNQRALLPNREAFK
jgi:hypothetical protein